MGGYLLDCGHGGCIGYREGGASDEMPPWYHTNVCMNAEEE